MAGFTLPITLPLSWQSARSAQFWAGQDRRIYARFYISRPDGVTWQDMTSYLVSARISLGNVADVGTGNSGVDTGVRQATFELINERRPEIAWDETLAQDETYVVSDEADVVGDSADGGELIINKLFGATPKSYYAGDSLHPRDRNSSWNYWNGAYAPLLWPTREVILDVAAVPVGITPGPADWVRLFHGFMGDSISASSDNGRITIECRDLMKRLQSAYIETVRQYGSEAGTPAETVMQQIINDNITVNPPQLYVPVSPGFMIRPYKVEYQTVADALWQVVNQFGGWLGYKWIPDYNDFRLTLLIPPRNKDASSADWVLDWAKDIYIQQLDISDRDVRNALVLTYRDSAVGTRQSVVVEDAVSIAEFGRRAMQIEEADTSLIDTQAEAIALAKAVIHDLKGLTSTTRINMPFMPTMDVFDGIIVANPRLSSTQDFYAVESVEHQLDFARGQFRTEAIASGYVVGAHTRWLLTEARPGAKGEPIGADRIVTRTYHVDQAPISTAGGFLEIIDTGLIQKDTTGAQRVHVGDISGRPWGSGVLPVGTYGMWGVGAGIFLQDYPQILFAGSWELKYTESGVAIQSLSIYNRKKSLLFSSNYDNIQMYDGRAISVLLAIESAYCAESSSGIVRMVPAGYILRPFVYEDNIKQYLPHNTYASKTYTQYGIEFDVDYMAIQSGTFDLQFAFAGVAFFYLRDPLWVPPKRPLFPL